MFKKNTFSLTSLKFLGLFLSIVLLNSCQDNSLKGYYYKLEDHKEPKFYFYKCLEDPSLNQYWKVSANLEDQTMTTVAYDVNFEKLEYFKERFNDKGAFMLEYYMIIDGERISCRKKNTSVFLWNSQESYEYNIYYSEGGFDTELTKTRKYGGKDRFKIFGKIIDVIKMNDIYEYRDINSLDTYSINQTTYYSKEYSYVKYERTFDDHESITFELQSILSEKEWNRLLKSSNKMAN